VTSAPTRITHSRCADAPRWLRAGAIGLGFALAFVALTAPAHARHRNSHGAVPVESLRAAEDVVLAAHDAAERNDRERLARLARQHEALLRNHPLSMYVDFWLLRERLKSDAAVQIDGEVSAFIERHPQTYIADRMRLEWAMALAARAATADAAPEAWALFDRERERVVRSDEPQLRCWTMLSRYQRNEGRRIDELAREARELLSTARDASRQSGGDVGGGDGCLRLTEVLLDDGRIGLFERVRALVEHNQFSTARRLAARAAGNDVAQVNAALDRPAAWLTALSSKGTRASAPEREIALIALARLSRDSPDLAARHALTLDPLFSAEQRGLAWGRIGHMAAVKHAPDALELYRRGGAWVGAAPGATRVDEVLEWQVRAALRAADGPDWAVVRAAIERMPADLQNEPAWIYWHARALFATGGAVEFAAARDRLRSISAGVSAGGINASAINYYGLLAAEALGEPVSIPAQAAPVAPEAVAAFEGNAGLERAFLFYELGLRIEGHREWNWQIRRANDSLDDRGLLALAEFARKRGVWDRVIATSERTRQEFDFGQRYPAPHREQLFEHTSAAGLDATWVYGLIRQESRFIADARSSAGAVGLMQLMPATARYVARRAGLSDFLQARISDTDVNLRLGTHYLRYVFDDLDGSALLASAAYNAGPSRARAWRASLPRAVEGAVFAETIPLNETRDYVKRVLANAVIYSAVLGDGRVPSLQARLGQVAPKAAGTTELP
jgi:soluble lytic murein transglycosylase